MVSGVAVAASGLTVGSALVGHDAGRIASTAADLTGSEPTPDAERSRAEGGDRGGKAAVSRSGPRSPLDQATKSPTPRAGGGEPQQEDESANRPPLADLPLREVARRLMPEYGLDPNEFECLDALWVSESDWEVDADNPTSSAYGIPQALTSMYDLPEDYMTNPVSQIRWGLWYIDNSYGSACSAWEFKQENNWY